MTGRPDDTVAVWDVDLAPDAPHDLPVTAAERSRAARLADPERGAALLRSHAAVRCLLARSTGLPARAVAWTTGAHGKPAAVGPYAWNLSRSGRRALVAIARGPALGVDLQAEHPHGDPVRLARRFLAPAEAGRVAAAPDGGERVRRLCRVLSRKEAWAKAAGGRLLHFLRRDADGPQPTSLDGAPYVIADLDAGPGYAAALATAGRDPRPVAYHICDWRDLCVPN